MNAEPYLSYTVTGNIATFEENGSVVYSCIKGNPYEITINIKEHISNVFLVNSQILNLQVYLFPIKKTDDPIQIPQSNVSWTSNVKYNPIRIILTVRFSILSSQAGNAFDGPNKRYIGLRINDIKLTDKIIPQNVSYSYDIGPFCIRSKGNVTINASDKRGRKRKRKSDKNTITTMVPYQPNKKRKNDNNELVNQLKAIINGKDIGHDIAELKQKMVLAEETNLYIANTVNIIRNQILLQNKNNMLEHQQSSDVDDVDDNIIAELFPEYKFITEINNTIKLFRKNQNFNTNLLNDYLISPNKLSDVLKALKVLNDSFK